MLGLSRFDTDKLLARLAHLADPVGDPPTYDPRIVDLIQAMRGQPHRSLSPADRDWLAGYLQGEP